MQTLVPPTNLAATGSASSSIESILALKRSALSERKARTPIEAVRALASMQKRPEPILCAIGGTLPTLVIGQIRYAGSDAYDPVALALRFVRAGLDGVSLFTDEVISRERPYSSGLNDLTLISRAVRVPVLTQDYVFDEYQIVEARAAGASAVQLCAGMMDAGTLRKLVSITQRHRMTPVVGVRSAADLDAALAFGASVIALGERDARGNLSIAALQQLRARIGCGISVVVAPALQSFEEAAAVMPLKPDAVMIDEVLLARPDAIERLRRL